MKVKIIGLDESGKTADPYIIFSQVEFDEEYEPDIIIKNIINSGDVVYKRNIMQFGKIIN